MRKPIKKENFNLFLSSCSINSVSISLLLLFNNSSLIVASPFCSPDGTDPFVNHQFFVINSHSTAFPEISVYQDKSLNTIDRSQNITVRHIKNISTSRFPISPFALKHKLHHPIYHVFQMSDSNDHL